MPKLISDYERSVLLTETLGRLPQYTLAKAPPRGAKTWAWYRFLYRHALPKCSSSMQREALNLLWSKFFEAERAKLHKKQMLHVRRMQRLGGQKRQVKFWAELSQTQKGYYPTICLSRCGCCGLLLFLGWSELLRRGPNVYCGTCAALPRCGRCDLPVAPGTRSDGEGFCTRCQRELRREVIQSYSTRAPEALNVGRLDPKKLYFGVELELESRTYQEDAYQVKKIVGNWAILKSDGSLLGGFETVTRPATLKEHLKNWPEMLPRFPASLRGDSGHCGLHIHVSRRPLSSLQIARAVCFINSPDNLGMVEKIARRSSNSYSKITKKTPEELAFLLKHHGRGGALDRYEALNLVNHDTIEFRLFKATKNPKVLNASLEFCASLLEFCATGNAGFNGLTWLAYEKWLRHERGRKSFPWLLRFLDKYVYNKPKPDAELVAKTRAKILAQGTKRARARAARERQRSIGPQRTNWADIS